MWSMVLIQSHPKALNARVLLSCIRARVQDHPWYDAASIRLQQQAATPDNILWGNWQASVGLLRRLLWRQRCGLPHNSDSSRVHL